MKLKMPSNYSMPTMVELTLGKLDPLCKILASMKRILVYMKL